MNKYVTLIFLLGNFFFASIAYAEVSSGYEKSINWEVTYPIISISNNIKVQNLINADLNQYLEALREDFQSGKYYMCREWYTVHYEDNDVISISIGQLREPYRSFGNHSNTFDIVFSKKTGVRIPLYNYVRITPSDLDGVYKWEHAYNWENKLIKYDKYFDPKIKKIPENYYLLGDGIICIVFQPYQIGYGADGSCYIKLYPDYIDYLNRKNKW